MSTDFQPGERVGWKHGAAKMEGVVVKKLTSTEKVGTKEVRASPEDPRYIVRSDKTGRELVRKPQALSRLRTEEAGEKRKEPEEAEGGPEQEARKGKAARVEEMPEKMGAEKAREEPTEKKEEMQAVQVTETTEATTETTTAPTEAPESVIGEFRNLVNMNEGEMEEWLKTEDSKQVGWKPEEGAETMGPESGQAIVEILKKQESEYTEQDVQHMRRVCGYIKKHLEQRPTSETELSRWRFSLMNWGHDPLKGETKGQPSEQEKKEE